MERRGFLVGMLTVTAMAMTNGRANAAELLAGEEKTIAGLVSRQGGLRADASDDMYLIFEAFENIPDFVIRQGEKVANEWIRNYINSRYSPSLDIASSSDGVAFKPAGVNWPGCIGAVGLALLNHAIPILKITKLKAFFKGIGGVKTFIDAYSRSYQKLHRYGFRGADLAKRAAMAAAHQAGPEVKDALLSIFGLSVVVGACTAW